MDLRFLGGYGGKILDGDWFTLRSLATYSSSFRGEDFIGHILFEFIIKDWFVG